MIKYYPERQKRPLSTLKVGTHFIYGDIEWVKLDDCNEPGRESVIALAAEPIYTCPFDEDDRNDWSRSSLRYDLSEEFPYWLSGHGVVPEDFARGISDLTADDGVHGYYKSCDEIGLISRDLYQKYRELIPETEKWWWTLTPTMADPKHGVLIVNPDGTTGSANASCRSGGVRPFCHFRRSILVAIKKSSKQPEQMNRKEMEEESYYNILEVMLDYPEDVWIGSLIEAINAVCKEDTDCLVHLICETAKALAKSGISQKQQDGECAK